MALAAALGDDLDAPASGGTDPLAPQPNRGPMGPLPSGIDLLAAHVTAPPELARRLKQIGIVARRDGERLQHQLMPGQRLVSARATCGAGTASSPPRRA